MFLWFIQKYGFKICDNTKHFLYFQDALSLPSRPPLHNSTLMLFITILIHATNVFFCTVNKDVDILSQTQPISMSLRIATLLQSLRQNAPWLFLTAWTSHHVRDGSRRGLWFAPAGSTEPLGRTGYVLATMLIPLCVRGCMMFYQPHLLSAKTARSLRQAIEHV